MFRWQSNVTMLTYPCLRIAVSLAYEIWNDKRWNCWLRKETIIIIIIFKCYWHSSQSKITVIIGLNGFFADSSNNSDQWFLYRKGEIRWGRRSSIFLLLTLRCATWIVLGVKVGYLDCWYDCNVILILICILYFVLKYLYLFCCIEVDLPQ